MRNYNLLTMFLTAFMMFWISSAPSFAVDEDIIVDPPGVISRMLAINPPPTISVRIRDQAQGGCWTNLRESRTYAVDTLENIGFDVDDNSSIIFDILVFAARSPAGFCFGHMRAEFAVHRSDGFSRAVANRTAIFVQREPANTMILDVIGELGRALMADSRR